METKQVIETKMRESLEYLHNCGATLLDVIDDGDTPQIEEIYFKLCGCENELYEAIEKFKQQNNKNNGNNTNYHSNGQAH